MAKVLALSASPIKGGSLEKGLAAVIEASGFDGEIVRLYDHDIKVCIACKKCAATNRCIMKDDTNLILEKIIAADALLFSGYPSYGSVNAMMKVFIEKMWPLRHNHLLTKGKASASVVCGMGGGPVDLQDYFAHYLDYYLGTKYVGCLSMPGNAPCLSCGYGETCEYGAVLAMYGPGAKITPDKFNDFNNNEEGLAKARELGQALAATVNS